MPMRNSAYITGVAALLVILTLSVPAGAMTADTLIIRLADDGRADITFTYSLSWYEHFAVYLRMVNPAKELKSALERNFRKPVDVTSIDSGRVDLSIEEFATIKNPPGAKSPVYSGDLIFGGEEDPGELLVRTPGIRRFLAFRDDPPVPGRPGGHFPRCPYYPPAVPSPGARMRTGYLFFNS